jgi:hypothetical protein
MSSFVDDKKSRRVYKKGIDAGDARTKRQESAVQIRKVGKQEQLKQKRGLGMKNKKNKKNCEKMIFEPVKLGKQDMFDYLHLVLLYDQLHDYGSIREDKKSKSEFEDFLKNFLSKSLTELLETHKGSLEFFNKLKKFKKKNKKKNKKKWLEGGVRSRQVKGKNVRDVKSNMRLGRQWNSTKLTNKQMGWVEAAGIPVHRTSKVHRTADSILVASPSDIDTDIAASEINFLYTQIKKAYINVNEFLLYALTHLQYSDSILVLEKIYYYFGLEFNIDVDSGPNYYNIWNERIKYDTFVDVLCEYFNGNCNFYGGNKQMKGGGPVESDIMKRILNLINFSIIICSNLILEKLKTAMSVSTSRFYDYSSYWKENISKINENISEGEMGGEHLYGAYEKNLARANWEPIFVPKYLLCDECITKEVTQIADKRTNENGYTKLWDKISGLTCGEPGETRRFIINNAAYADLLKTVENNQHNNVATFFDPMSLSGFKDIYETRPEQALLVDSTWSVQTEDGDVKFELSVESPQEIERYTGNLTLTISGEKIIDIKWDKTGASRISKPSVNNIIGEMGKIKIPKMDFLEIYKLSLIKGIGDQSQELSVVSKYKPGKNDKCNGEMKTKKICYYDENGDALRLGLANDWLSGGRIIFLLEKAIAGSFNTKAVGGVLTIKNIAIAFANERVVDSASTTAMEDVATGAEASKTTIEDEEEEEEVAENEGINPMENQTSMEGGKKSRKRNKKLKRKKRKTRRKRRKSKKHKKTRRKRKKKKRRRYTKKK